MTRKLLIISILWGILIFVLCSIPGNSLPKSPSIPHFDKMVHAGLYFILTIALLPALDLSKNQFIRKIAPILILIIAALYGGIIEIAQQHLFTNRSGDIKDLIADLTGALIAIILYYTLTFFLKPLNPLNLFPKHSKPFPKHSKPFS